MDPGPSRYRVVAIAVVAVILVLGALALTEYAQVSTSGSASTSSSSSTSRSTVYVLVFGIVGTTGSGTKPVSMNFTSLTTSAQYVAQVSSGHFSVQLPDHDSYNVTMAWSGNCSWQRGEVGAGSFTVEMTGTSDLGESYNVVLPTPDSVVAVNGTVSWPAATSTAVAIRFIAGDGENFTAPLSSDAFSVRLPNLMDYQVGIESQNSTGYREWYSAQALAVDAGVGVTGLTVAIS